MIFKQWATWSSPVWLGTKQGCHLLLPCLFNIILEVLANTVRKGKETECTQGRKEEIKFSLFLDDMIVDVENSKESTKTLLEPITTIASF
jgi:hypothetical protein